MYVTADEALLYAQTLRIDVVDVMLSPYEFRGTIVLKITPLAAVILLPNKTNALGYFFQAAAGPPGDFLCIGLPLARLCAGGYH